MLICSTYPELGRQDTRSGAVMLWLRGSRKEIWKEGNNHVSVHCRGVKGACAGNQQRRISMNSKFAAAATKGWMKIFTIRSTVCAICFFGTPALSVPVHAPFTYHEQRVIEEISVEC